MISVLKKMDTKEACFVLGILVGTLSAGESILLPLTQSLHATGFSSNGAGITLVVSEKGVSYARDVLVKELLQEMTPLHLPKITKRVQFTVGYIDISLLDIVLRNVQVEQTETLLDENGILIFGSGVHVELDFNWKYKYSVRRLVVSDRGHANVEVKGAQAGITLYMNEQDGTIQLTTLQCGAYLEELDISLQGGASWFYSWFLYAFKAQLRATVERAMRMEIVEAVEDFNVVLKSVPRQVPIDETCAMDFSVTENPSMTSTYLSVKIKGQVVSLLHSDNRVSTGTSPDALVCDASSKMVTMALGELVLQSAAAVYYEAGRFKWQVDKIPNQFLLNTASWRYIVPQLYKKYPDKNLTLKFSASSIPDVFLQQDGIHAVANADMIIQVLLDNQTAISVACIGLAISLHGLVWINGNKISGRAALRNLSLELRWSDVGKFPIRFLQTTVRAIVKGVVIPVLNLSLRKGIPLPSFPRAKLVDAQVKYLEGLILVCTDVEYTGKRRVSNFSSSLYKA